MTISYTDKLRLSKLDSFSSSNVWGQTLNSGVIRLAEDAITGHVDVNVTVGSVTLSQANGAPDQARCLFLRAIGDPGTVRDVVVPPIPRLYIIENATNPPHDVVFRTPAGSGVTLPVGRVLAVMVDPASLDVVPLVAAGAFVEEFPYTSVPVSLTDSPGTATIDYTVQGGIVIASLSGVAATFTAGTWIYETTGLLPASTNPAVEAAFSIHVNDGGVIVPSRLVIPSDGSNWVISALSGAAYQTALPREVIDLSLAWMRV